jgi:hypothetical protein
MVDITTSHPLLPTVQLDDKATRVWDASDSWARYMKKGMWREGVRDLLTQYCIQRSSSTTNRRPSPWCLKSFHAYSMRPVRAHTDGAALAAHVLHHLVRSAWIRLSAAFARSFRRCQCLKTRCACLVKFSSAVEGFARTPETCWAAIGGAAGTCVGVRE